MWWETTLEFALDLLVLHFAKRTFQLRSVSFNWDSTVTQNFFNGPAAHIFSFPAWTNIKKPSCFNVKHKQGAWLSLHKKWRFPLRISSVNVTKSAVSCYLVTFTVELLNGKFDFCFLCSGCIYCYYLMIKLLLKRETCNNKKAPATIVLKLLVVKIWIKLISITISKQ